MTGAAAEARSRATAECKCWWCNSGERQSRHHLFVKCRTWEAQVKELWKSVGKACEWKHPRAPAVRLLFRDERATPAVLQFLQDTKVGRMATRSPREEEGEWEGLEEAELWPGEDEG